MKGRAHIYGGRKRIRCALYMSSIVAIRCNEQMRMFYKKLKEQGKPSKVALIAVARKMIVILNAQIRDYLKSSSFLLDT